MMFRSMIAAGALALAAAPAHATLETVLWSGAQFGNAATAIGHFDISPTAADLGGAQNLHSFPSAGFHLIDLTIAGASSGDGTFAESDFASYYFASFSQLDFSKQLIGQPMTNGCNYGDFGSCYGGPSGDFNLFSTFASPSTPQGTFYFTLTTEGGNGDQMAVISISPSVPEPAAWALMLVGVGMVGVAARRRKAAIAA